MSNIAFDYSIVFRAFENMGIQTEIVFLWLATHLQSFRVR